VARHAATRTCERAFVLRHWTEVGKSPHDGQSYRNDSDEAIALEAVRRSTLSCDADDFRVTLTSGHGGERICLWRDPRLRLC